MTVCHSTQTTQVTRVAGYSDRTRDTSGRVLDRVPVLTKHTKTGRDANDLWRIGELMEDVHGGSICNGQRLRAALGSAKQETKTV